MFKHMFKDEKHESYQIFIRFWAVYLNQKQQSHIRLNLPIAVWLSMSPGQLHLMLLIAFVFQPQFKKYIWYAAIAPT